VSAFTSRDVARVAGVSQSTVSYVMSGRRPISAHTRAKVEAAIQQLTYHPHAGARALASQRSSVIGLVIPFSPGADTHALLPFIEDITRLARERDHETLLATSDEGSAGLRRLIGRKLSDGLLILDVRTHDDRIPVLKDLGVPAVLIGVPADSAGLRCVDTDFEQGARLAVAELAATGHDRLVLLGHPAQTTSNDLSHVGRFSRAARATADELGVELHEPGTLEWSRRAIAACVERILAQDLPAARRLGLVVPSSRSVDLVLQELLTRGVVPGRDVSVVGVATDEIAVECVVPLTSVSQEPLEVSRIAMDLLFEALDDRAAPDAGELVTRVPMTLRRRSTVMPPGPR
jgi:DNA-binding LacI/PurR family transcriptional regulator